MQYYDKILVGSRIKKIRKRRNMTQSKLAEVLDYTSERQLQRIENGETGCTIDKLMEIVQILDTSADYLLFGIEIDSGSISNKLSEGKTKGQKIFIQKILEVVIENMELLVSGS